jgi:hypothetical protein
MFSSSRELHRFTEEHGGIICWESTPLWLRLHARMKPEMLKRWLTMVCTPGSNTRRALIVPKAAMSGEDRMALREWQTQRRNTFARLNGRG